MEVAIVAGFFAIGNMNIDARHRIFNFTANFRASGPVSAWQR
jgi:hypothetical protein